MAMTQEETEAAAVRGVQLSPEQMQKLRATLLNLDGKTSLARRFRALFALRGVANSEAIQIISEGVLYTLWSFLRVPLTFFMRLAALLACLTAFQDTSALLGHELAYCLGQIKSSEALPQLEALVKDTSRHPMVRHEAAEAMGAISDPSSMSFLRQYAENEENAAVRETCEIALAKLEYDHGAATQQSSERSLYDSIDPAPALAMHETTTKTHQAGKSIDELQEMLMDPSLPLFQRYRAMFTLRNIASDPAVLALASGFKDSSALFRCALPSFLLFP